MRLVCPNCDAEYEVDDAAIPHEGRDVQCSNCGHAWFQNHPELEAEAEAEADLYDAPEGAAPVAAEAVGGVADAPPAAPVADPVAASPSASPGSESPAPASPTPAPAAEAGGKPKTRSLDETVLAVLREEAEREAAARRAEAQAQPAFQSQTEMPLAPAADAGGMAAAVKRIAKLRGMAVEPGPAAEPEAVEVGPAAAAEATPAKSRMFPAIEEINSTLRATGDRVEADEDAVVDTLPDLNKPRGGFGRGFVLLVSLAVVIVALYVLAPMVAVKVPALAGAAAAYVAAVDAARVWLDVNLRALVAMLRDMAGGQGG